MACIAAAATHSLPLFDDCSQCLQSCFQCCAAYRDQMRDTLILLVPEVGKEKTRPQCT